jgi:hypothetical protein
LKEAQIVIEQWRNQFNTSRLLIFGYQPPAPQTSTAYYQSGSLRPHPVASIRLVENIPRSANYAAFCHKTLNFNANALI